MNAPLQSLLITLAVTLIPVASVAATTDSLVKTELGELRGSIDPTTQVAVFKGVPFAEPPVGDLRWREPQPPRAWGGVRDATHFGASPIQRIHGDFLPWTSQFLVQNEISEDCLYLNIWTPSTVTNAKKPVLVFIPGGGFVEGSGEVPVYDGARLAKLGIVVVTTNYRLGVLGFLAHPLLTAESPHHTSGNYALMDQVAALEWVKHNISAFGGDPSAVTVWGQSAGAFSVGALLASPRAHGLFQRAIADSGLSVGGFPMKTLAAAEAEGSQFAEDHHATTLAALRAIPAEQLIKSGRVGAIQDGWFLPESIASIESLGTGTDVPVLTGYQANDGLLSLPHVTSLEDFKNTLQSMYGPATETFEQLYPAASVADIKVVLLESARDRERVGMYLWGQRRSHSYKDSVYTYFFVRAVPWPEHPEFGAFHSGELPYFFGNFSIFDRPWQPIDFQLADTVEQYILNFTRSGNPNGPGLPIWKPVQDAPPATLQLGEEIKSIPLADEKKFAFWKNYFASQEPGKVPVF